MNAIKTRENRVRRILRTDGLLIRKSRLRSQPHAHDYGGYMVLNLSNVVQGRADFRYKLEDLEVWADEIRAERGQDGGAA